MAHLDLYETPSNEILRHRRGFYDLWKRCDDQTAAWLDRVQSQISLCEFPPLISREYLLIDKFLCELDDDERAFIQSVDTWTLIKLKDFVERQMPSLLPSSKTVAVECELVSNLKHCILVLLAIQSISFPVCFRMAMNIRKILQTSKWRTKRILLR